MSPKSYVYNFKCSKVIGVETQLNKNTGWQRNNCFYN